MSVSMYRGRVASLERELADLRGKAAKARADASKERDAGNRKLGQITKHTSETSAGQKRREAERAFAKAAKRDEDAASLDKRAAAKERDLGTARDRLADALKREDKRGESEAKRRRREELRELQAIERARRASQEAPSVSVRPAVIPAPPEPTEERPRYDVCLSFAGEQRSYVELVARALKERDYRVFYDEDEQAELWGKDLAEHFDWIYREGSRFCLMFISKEYAEKPWTRHERRSALARAIEQDEYVLPARFDDTELDGLRPTVGYVDLSQYAPASLADLIAEKLGDPLAPTNS